MLNSSPADSCISFVSPSIFPVRYSPKCDSCSLSIKKPSSCISASTCISGSSILLYSSSCSSSFILPDKASLNENSIAALSPKKSAAPPASEVSSSKSETCSRIPFKNSSSLTISRPRYSPAKSSIAEAPFAGFTRYDIIATSSVIGDIRHLPESFTRASLQSNTIFPTVSSSRSGFKAFISSSSLMSERYQLFLPSDTVARKSVPPEKPKRQAASFENFSFKNSSGEDMLLVLTLGASAVFSAEKSSRFKTELSSSLLSSPYSCSLCSMPLNVHSSKSKSSGTSRTIVASSLLIKADSLPSVSRLSMTPLTGASSILLYIFSMLPIAAISFSAVFSPIPLTPGMLSDWSPIKAFTSINSFGVTPYFSITALSS